ncbi:MAG: energy transducer TonB [Woeseiaceae bacterium]|nr:energy transducer TonB [Woeseiaceae bacterium]
MTETKENSSLPLLFAITGAVVAVAGGGWFLLSQESGRTEPVESVRAEAEPVEQAVPDADVAEPDTTDAPFEVETVSAAASETRELDVDSELSKARLAAGADILVLPEEQSAIYYYGRALELDPDNEVANAELEAMLARVQQAVEDQLEAEDFEAAYEIAVIVARHRPRHELVTLTQTTLDDLTEGLVAEAMEAAQRGNDETAADRLAEAEALPGRNPEYFAAIRESMTEVRDVRVAAERDRQQRARLAAEEARAAWVASVEGAIAAGNLVTPAGASARDVLAETNSWSDDRERLTNELAEALVETTDMYIGTGEFEQAERLLGAAIELRGNADVYSELSVRLEAAMIDAESNRLIDANELVLLQIVPPKYPRRAAEREVSGWVELEFMVMEDGTTSNVEISRSEPDKVFDRAAIDAVERWEFEPVVYRGQTIAKRVATRVVFRLE